MLAPARDPEGGPRLTCACAPGSHLWRRHVRPAAARWGLCHEVSGSRCRLGREASRVWAVAGGFREEEVGCSVHKATFFSLSSAEDIFFHCF